MHNETLMWPPFCGILLPKCALLFFFLTFYLSLTPPVLVEFLKSSKCAVVRCLIQISSIFFLEGVLSLHPKAIKKKRCQYLLCILPFFFYVSFFFTKITEWLCATELFLHLNAFFSLDVFIFLFFFRRIIVLRDFIIVYYCYKHWAVFFFFS